MRLEDYTIVPNLGRKFMGIYARGPNDSVPLDHAIDAQDCVFNPGYFSSRPGSFNSTTLPDGGSGVRRWYIWNRIGATDEVIYLDNSGNIYRSGQSGTPLYTNAGCTDFSIFSTESKLFIAPHDGNKGISGQNLQVYSGVAGSSTATTSRDIGLLQDDNAISTYVLNNVAGPVIDIGRHKFGIVYVTDTGHLHADAGVDLTAPVLIDINGGINAAINGITSNGTNISNNDTVTVNGKVYTFKTALTPTEGQVLIGSDTTTSLTNLVSAINHAGVPGTDYSCALQNPDASAELFYPIIRLTAITSGSAGNALTLVKSAATLTIDKSTFYNGTDGFTITLNISVAPGVNLNTSVKYMYVIATKGNENEFFFVPGAIYNPDNANVPYFNSGTHTITLNFLDTDLIESADYLFDQFDTVQVGSGLELFAGRLILYGFPSPNASLVRGSRSQANLINPDLESFSQIDGFFLVNEDDGDGVFNACPLTLELLYLYKNTGTYVTQDSGGEPATWVAKSVDNAHGCFLHCIDTFAAGNANKQMLNSVLVASSEGLFNFNGNYPEIALTWKIDDIWKSINLTYFYRTQVVQDTVHKLIYILCVTGVATNYNTLIVGDYTNGLTPSEIVWNRFVFFKQPSSIGIFNTNDARQVFCYSTNAGSSDGLLQGWDPTITQYIFDNAGLATSFPNSFYKLAWAYLMSGMIHFFAGFRIKANTAISGSNARVQVSSTLMNNTSGTSYDSTSLASGNIEKKELLFRGLNAQSEKVSLTITPINANIAKIDILAKIKQQMWPS